MLLNQHMLLHVPINYNKSEWHTRPWCCRSYSPPSRCVPVAVLGPSSSCPPPSATSHSPPLPWWCHLGTPPLGFLPPPPHHQPGLFQPLIKTTVHYSSSLSLILDIWRRQILSAVQFSYRNHILISNEGSTTEWTDANVLIDWIGFFIASAKFQRNYNDGTF